MQPSLVYRCNIPIIVNIGLEVLEKVLITKNQSAGQGPIAIDQLNINTCITVIKTKQQQKRRNALTFLFVQEKLTFLN